MIASLENKVGIVLVSHSAKLAEAVVELAKQMTQDRNQGRHLRLL